MIHRNSIDNSRSFDWGKISEDYGKYRDIYPVSFYRNLLSLGIGKKGHKILDLGTGTGVLPRNLYQHGAKFIGIDISSEQIQIAKIISQGMGMDIMHALLKLLKCFLKVLTLLRHANASYILTED